MPEEWHGKKVIALIAVSAGPIEEAEAQFSSFRAVAEPVADLLGPMPYTAMQTLIDPLWPKGIHAYFKATNLARLDDELIERLAELHQAAPGPQCEIHVHQMGGAVARVGEGDTAFSERSMPYVLNAVTGWHDPAQAEAHTQWARSVIVAAAADASTGRAYVNFLGDADSGALRPTGPRPTSGWSRSSASTTRRTCSGSTRTSTRRPLGALGEERGARGTRLGPAHHPGAGVKRPHRHGPLGVREAAS